VPSSLRDTVVQQSIDGLSPNQATFTSGWQTFDGPPVVAKAPVQRWKDERGIEHFVDVLPTVKASTGVEAMRNKYRSKAQ